MVGGSGREYKALRRDGGKETRRTMTSPSFVTKIRGARDVHEKTLDEFRALVRERKETPGFTLQERFTGDDEVVPYYDYDVKYEKEPDEAEKKGKFDSFKSDLSLIHPGE